MNEEIKKGVFESKYSLDEIVELKMKGAEHFMGQVKYVVFDSGSIMYGVRRIDGIMININENELCIRGIDYEL